MKKRIITLVAIVGLTVSAVGSAGEVPKKMKKKRCSAEADVCLRAMTEKLYGPTFDWLRIEIGGTGEIDRLGFLFSQAAREAAPTSRQPFDEMGRLYTVRMPESRAAEFSRRLIELADEFADAGSEGPMFGFAGSVFLVDLPGGSG